MRWRFDAHIDLTLIDVGQTCHRARQRLGNSTKRHVESLRDIAVTQPFGTQEETLPIALWQGEHDGAKPARAPIVGELLLRIRRRIDHAIDERDVPGAFPSVPSRRLLALLEREVMPHPEDPPAQVGARAAELKVPEQLEEHFLDDVLGDLDSQPERADVATQARRALVEQPEHFALGRGRRLAVADETGRQMKDQTQRSPSTTWDQCSTILHAAMWIAA